MHSLKKSLFLFLLISLFTSETQVYAQYFPLKNYWRDNNTDITLGIGAANYLGELGGRDDLENRLKFLNIEPSKFRWNINIGLSRHLSQVSTFRIDLSHLMVSGDDALTNNPLRNNRNLSFRSHVIELAGRYEYHFFRPKIGHHNSIRWADNQKFKLFGMYGFVGVGGFFFNPKANYQGEWIALQPLGTEGQGLPGEADNYSRIAFSFPMGLGIQYYLGFKTRIGFEANYRFTSTDYLDDVSTFYYDNNKLRAEKGDIAAALADRNSGENPAEWTVAGAIRGNPDNNDSFFSFSFTLTTALFHNQELVRKLQEKKLKKKKIKLNPVRL